MSRVSGEVKVEKAASPDWPQLQPLIPTSDLILETLVENQIILLRNLFTSTLCKTYVSFLSTLPFVTTPGRPKKGEALRVNDRYQVDDPEFAAKLWNSTALKELITGQVSGNDEEDSMLDEDKRKLWGGDVVGLNPRIRIYRYRNGQFFAPHYDESNSITLPTSPPTPAETTWTLLIYLTSPANGCIGGETVFYPDDLQKDVAAAKSSSRGHVAVEPIVVGLETGMALLHRHGNQCMLHEGREVTAGEKWVIRSDLCVRRDRIRELGVPK